MESIFFVAMVLKSLQNEASGLPSLHKVRNSCSDGAQTLHSVPRHQENSPKLDVVEKISAKTIHQAPRRPDIISESGVADRERISISRRQTIDSGCEVLPLQTKEYLCINIEFCT